MKNIINLKMCGHFINNQEFKVFWFRGILPISVNDFNFFPILANFITLMESLKFRRSWGAFE